MSSKDIGPRKSNQYESQLILTPPQANSSRKLGNCKAAPRGSNLPIEAICRFIKQTAMKPRHKLLLRFLADYRARFRRVCPSIRRLAKECGCSRQSIHNWLNELEQLGFIRREACYRSNGGKTSNLYHFTLHGHVQEDLQETVRKEEQVIHEAKPDVVRKDKFHIKPKEMKTAKDCQRLFEQACENRWIINSENNRFLFFTLFGFIVRQHRQGAIRSPGAYLRSCLSRNLLGKIGSSKDEASAGKALAHLRLRVA